MNGLKETMDKLTSSFEGIASLAELGTLAKTLKPDIAELTEAMSGIRELRSAISDLAKQTASIGDMKVLTSELRVAMREIRASVAGARAAPAPVSTSAPTPSIPKPTMVVKRPSTTAKTTTSTTTKVESKPIVYSAGRTKLETPTASPVTSSAPSPKPQIASSVKQAALQSEAKSAASKAKKVPDIVEEVFTLIVQRTQGGADAHSLAKVIENARDTISKSWKWHPSLYELGTFARKLRTNFKPHAIVRAMPNLAASVQKSMTTLTGDTEFKDEAKA